MNGFITVHTAGDNIERCLNVKYIAEFSPVPESFGEVPDAGATISLDFGVGWRMYVTETYNQVLGKVRAATGSIR